MRNVHRGRPGFPAMCWREGRNSDNDSNHSDRDNSDNNDRNNNNNDGNRNIVENTNNDILKKEKYKKLENGSGFIYVIEASISGASF